MLNAFDNFVTEVDGTVVGSVLWVAAAVVAAAAPLTIMTGVAPLAIVLGRQAQLMEDDATVMRRALGRQQMPPGRHIQRPRRRLRTGESRLRLPLAAAAHLGGERGEVDLAIALPAMRVAGPDQRALEEHRHEQRRAFLQLENRAVWKRDIHRPGS